MIKWTVIRAKIRPGTNRMCAEYNREMISPPGYSPPKTKNASQVPINGIDCKMPRMICRPVPESRSSGRE